MKAIVQARNARGRYSAKTDNNILLVFGIPEPITLALGEVIEVDLPDVLTSQQIVRLNSDRNIRIVLGPNDIHDLDLPADHGASRMPSPERMLGA